MARGDELKLLYCSPKDKRHVEHRGTSPEYQEILQTATPFSG